MSRRYRAVSLRHLAIAVGVTTAQVLVFGVGFGFAYGNADSSYEYYRQENQGGVYNARCWYQRALIRSPAQDSNNVLDYNAFTQSRVSSTSNCTFAVSGSPYSRPPYYLGAKARLYRVSPSVSLCAETGWDYNRNDAYLYGLGAGIRRDATNCGSGDYRAVADVFSRWNFEDETALIISPTHYFANI